MQLDPQYSSAQKRVVATYLVTPRDAATASGTRGIVHCSVQQAVDKAEPYSRIIFASGQYHERVTVTQPIEMIAEDGASPEFVGRGCLLLIAEDVECFASGIKFTSRNPPSAAASRGQDSAVRVLAGRPVFSRCEMTSLYVGGVADPVVRDCIVQGSLNGSGITVAEDASGLYERNVVRHHVPYCIAVCSRGTPKFVKNELQQSRRGVRALLQAHQAAAAVHVEHTGVVHVFAEAAQGRILGSGGAVFRGNAIRDDEMEAGPVTSSFQNRYRLEPTALARDTRAILRTVVRIDGGCAPEFEENTIFGGAVGLGIRPHAGGVYTENVLRKCAVCGIAVAERATALLRSNTTRDCTTGLIAFHAAAQLQRNMCRANHGAGMVLVTSPKGAPSCKLEGNAFVGNDTGLIVLSGIADLDESPPSPSGATAFDASDASQASPTADVDCAMDTLLERERHAALLNCFVSENRECGVCFVGAGRHATLRDSEIALNGAIGIYAGRSAAPLIIGCRVDKGHVGVLSETSAAPVVRGCNFIGQDEVGVFVTNHGAGWIADCTFGACRRAAILSEDAGHPTALRNHIRHGEGAGIAATRGGLGHFADNNISLARFGIEVARWGDAVFDRNTVDACSEAGIFAHVGGIGTFTHNVVTQCRTGALLVACHATLRGNRFAYCSNEGIIGGERCHATIEKNDIVEISGAGILLTGDASHCIVSGNTITRALLAGISATDGAGGVVRRNTIQDAGESGLMCGSGATTQFQSNTVLRTVGAGILARAGGRCCFHGDRIEDGRSDGCSILGASEAQLLHCTLRGNAGWGLMLHHGASGRVESTNLTGNALGGVSLAACGADAGACALFGLTIERNGPRGVHIPEAAVLRAAACELRGHAVGLDAASAGAAVLQRCYFEANDIGARFTGTSRARPVELRECSFEANRIADVAFTASGDATIQRCHFLGESPMGVYAGNEGRGLVSECDWVDVGRWGVVLGAGCRTTVERCHINVARGCAGAGVVACAGSRARITGCRIARRRARGTDAAMRRQYRASCSALPPAPPRGAGAASLDASGVSIAAADTSDDAEESVVRPEQQHTECAVALRRGEQCAFTDNTIEDEANVLSASAKRRSTGGGPKSASASPSHATTATSTLALVCAHTQSTGFWRGNTLAHSQSLGAVFVPDEDGAATSDPTLVSASDEAQRAVPGIGGITASVLRQACSYLDGVSTIVDGLECALFSTLALVDKGDRDGASRPAQPPTARSVAFLPVSKELDDEEGRDAPVWEDNKVSASRDAGLVVFPAHANSTGSAPAFLRGTVTGTAAGPGIVIGARAAPALTSVDVSRNARGGVQLCRDSAAVLRSCTVARNAIFGVLVDAHAGGTLDRCAVTDNQPDGVVVVHSARVMLHGCTFRSPGCNVRVLGSNPLMSIARCHFLSGASGISCETPGAELEVTCNTFAIPDGCGMTLGDASRVAVRRNAFTACAVGVRVTPGAAGLVEYNHFSRCGTGVECQGAPIVTRVCSNVFTNCVVALSADSCNSDLRISGNCVVGAVTAGFLLSSSSCGLYGNELVYSRGPAISVRGAGGTPKIAFNGFISAAGAGIQIADSAGAGVIGNVFHDCASGVRCSSRGTAVYATQNIFSECYEGWCSADGARPLVHRNVFSRCGAAPSSGITGGGSGGAIVMRTRGGGLFRECQMLDCFIGLHSESSGLGELRRCLFRGCATGALLRDPGTTTTLRRCAFQRGGACDIHVRDGGAPTILQCSLTCAATAVLLHPGASGRIERCVIRDGATGVAASGPVTTHMTTCTISGSGTAVFLGPEPSPMFTIEKVFITGCTVGLRAPSRSEAGVTSCLFAQNEVGAILEADSGVSITQCGITRSARAGIIMCGRGHARVKRCHIWDNAGPAVSLVYALPGALGMQRFGATRPASGLIGSMSLLGATTSLARSREGASGVSPSASARPSAPPSPTAAALPFSYPRHPSGYGGISNTRNTLDECDIHEGRLLVQASGGEAVLMGCHVHDGEQGVLLQPDATVALRGMYVYDCIRYAVTSQSPSCSFTANQFFHREGDGAFLITPDSAGVLPSRDSEILNQWTWKGARLAVGAPAAVSDLPAGLPQPIWDPPAAADGPRIVGVGIDRATPKARALKGVRVEGRTLEHGSETGGLGAGTGLGPGLPSSLPLAAALGRCHGATSHVAAAAVGCQAAWQLPEGEMPALGSVVTQLIHALMQSGSQKEEEVDAADARDPPTWDAALAAALYEQRPRVEATAAGAADSDQDTAPPAHQSPARPSASGTRRQSVGFVPKARPAVSLSARASQVAKSLPTAAPPAAQTPRTKARSSFMNPPTNAMS